MWIWEVQLWADFDGVKMEAWGCWQLPPSDAYIHSGMELICDAVNDACLLRRRAEKTSIALCITPKFVTGEESNKCIKHMTVSKPHVADRFIWTVTNEEERGHG